MQWLYVGMYIFAFYAFSNFSNDDVLILYQKKYFWAEDAAHLVEGLFGIHKDCRTYNLSTWKMEAGSPKVQSYPWCHSKKEASLGYVRPTKRMDYPETSQPGDPSHNQSPNTDTIEYTSKILLKGP